MSRHYTWLSLFIAFFVLFSFNHYDFTVISPPEHLPTSAIVEVNTSICSIYSLMFTCAHDEVTINVAPTKTSTTTPPRPDIDIYLPSVALNPCSSTIASNPVRSTTTSMLTLSPGLLTSSSQVSIDESAETTNFSKILTLASPAINIVRDLIGINSSSATLDNFYAAVNPASWGIFEKFSGIVQAYYSDNNFAQMFGFSRIAATDVTLFNSDQKGDLQQTPWRETIAAFWTSEALTAVVSAYLVYLIFACF